MMRVLDLFSGIGGMSLGLERAGMRTVALCEIDPLCRKFLAEKWPGVPCHDDVRTMQFPDCDIIAGGFPCQDLSVAGKGAGLSGERSGLYREVLRAIRLVGPKYVILENVAVLLSRGLGTILGDLAEIGYDAEWYCIPAARLGAPHRRDRIWIVAYPSRELWDGSRSSREGRRPEHSDGGQALADTNRLRESQSQGIVCKKRGRLGNSGEDVPDTNGPRLALWESFASHDGDERKTSLRDSWWPAEPAMGGTSYGLSAGMDKIGDGDKETAVNYGKAGDQDYSRSMSDMRSSYHEKNDERKTGGQIDFSSEEILRPFVHGKSYAEGNCRETGASLEGSQEQVKRVRGVRRDDASPRPPLRRESIKQRPEQSSDVMPILSRFLARNIEETRAADLWPSSPVDSNGQCPWERGEPRVTVAIPGRVDQIRMLGNSLIPHIPELIGRAILVAEEAKCPT